MALDSPATPLIEKGWIRALLLIFVYVSLSVGAGYLLPSSDYWITSSFLIALVLVYVFRVYIDRKSFASIGLRWNEFVPHALTGLLMGILLVCSGTLVLYVMQKLEWFDVTTNVNTLFYNGVILLMAAFAEELVFRGYALRNLMKSFNKWIALVISSGMFTLVHASNPGVPPIALANTFIAGFVLGLTFINSRSLWLPLLFHFTWNFLQGPVLGFRVSGYTFPSIVVMQPKGEALVSGGEYGFEGSLICSLLLMLALLLWIYLERRRPGAADSYFQQQIS